MSNAETYRPLPQQFLVSALNLASGYEQGGRTGTALALYALVDEIETLREAAKGSLVIVKQAGSMAKLAELKASTLLIIAEKVAAAIGAEDWRALQSLSDELHASIKLAKG